MAANIQNSAKGPERVGELPITARKGVICTTMNALQKKVTRQAAKQAERLQVMTVLPEPVRQSAERHSRAANAGGHDLGHHQPRNGAAADGEAEDVAEDCSRRKSGGPLEEYRASTNGEAGAHAYKRRAEQYAAARLVYEV